MKTTKKIEINASSEAVWDVFAKDFNNAYKWMASVPSSFGKQLGEQYDVANSAGRVCELDGNPKGIKAYETIEGLDDASKSMKIRITFRNTPFGFPIVENNTDFQVVERSSGQSQVVFIVDSQLKPWAYVLYPLVKLGFGFFVGQIVEELKYYVENGTPHPRKLKALKKSN